MSVSVPTRRALLAFFACMVICPPTPVVARLRRIMSGPRRISSLATVLLASTITAPRHPHFALTLSHYAPPRNAFARRLVVFAASSPRSPAATHSPGHNVFSATLPARLAWHWFLASSLSVSNETLRSCMHKLASHLASYAFANSAALRRNPKNHRRSRAPCRLTPVSSLSSSLSLGLPVRYMCSCNGLSRLSPRPCLLLSSHPFRLALVASEHHVYFAPRGTTTCRSPCFSHAVSSSARTVRLSCCA